MIRKIFKYVGIAVACLVVVLLSSALLYRKDLQHKVFEERTISSPSGINSLEPVRIGGIDQWIELRGQNVNNPILLFIHGGPGASFIPLAGGFQDPWEKYFTVVQWDQRGAGKTYTSNSKEVLRQTINVPQMEQDTLEVVNYLRNRFKRQKIFVVGHSWGSILGLWLAHEHPDLIYAYVGVGQVINFEQNEKVAYEDALRQARDHHNEQAVKELEMLAPYPVGDLDFGKLSTAKRWENELLGPPPTSLDGFFTVTRIASTPGYSLRDDYSFFVSQLFSAKILLPELMKLDLDRLGRDFRVPVFFLQGRHDPYCRASLIWEYSETINAPQKKFIWFEDSGHFPFFEEQQKFTDELLQRLLPVAN